MVFCEIVPQEKTHGRVVPMSTPSLQYETAFVRPDSQGSRDLFRRVLAAYQKNGGETVLTAAMAQTLLLPTSGPLEVVTSFFLASKFEDTAPLESVSLVKNFLHSSYAPWCLQQHEKVILARRGYVLPYKNKVRDMYNMIAELNLSVQDVSPYLYALIDSYSFVHEPNVTASEWMDAFVRRDHEVFKRLQGNCHSSVWCDFLSVWQMESTLKQDGMSTEASTNKTKAHLGGSPEGVIDLTLDSPCSQNVPAGSPCKRQKIIDVIDLCTP